MGIVGKGERLRERVGDSGEESGGRERGIVGKKGRESGGLWGRKRERAGFATTTSSTCTADIS